MSRQPASAPASLSETLVRFAGPLVDLAAGELDAAGTRAVLVVAQRVWNAHRSPLAALPGEAEAAELAGVLGAAPAQVGAAIAQLAHDRRTTHAADHREFLSVSTHHDGHEVRVRVEGTSPPEELSPFSELGGLQRERFFAMAGANLSTGAMLAGRWAFGPAVALPLLRTMLGAYKPPLTPEEAWELAGALAFLTDAASARDAVARALALSEPAERPTLLLMLTALGGEWPVPPRSAVLAGTEALHRATGGGEAGAEDMLLALWQTPEATRPRFAEGLIAAVKDPRDREVLAAMGALSPFSPAVRETFLRALAALKTASARAMLAALTPAMVGPAAAQAAQRLLKRGGPLEDGEPAIPGCPIAWPVEAAYLTAPDAVGTQGAFLVRRRPDGCFALFGALVSDRRGLTDDMAVPDLTPAGLAQVSAQWEVAVAVPVGAVVGRLLAGEAIARRHGYPLPLGYLVGRYLLSGLEDAEAPDLEAMAAERCDPALMAHTGAVLHTREAAGWGLLPWENKPTMLFLAEAESVLSKARQPKPRPAVFPAALQGELDAPDALAISEKRLEALDMVIVKALPGLLTAEVRGLWRNRLLQLMYLYETQGRPHLAAAAATAAEALGPHGRVMGQRIGFVMELLRRSALRCQVRW